MQFPGRSPSVGDGHAQSPTMGLSHCRCQDQWTARTLWTAKAAREAETNLCKRRSSAPPTASASGTFSMAADTRGQFHEWSKEQYVVRNSRCPWKLLPNNTPTLTRELSALSTSQASRNEKVPPPPTRQRCKPYSGLPWCCTQAGMSEPAEDVL